MKRGRCMVFEPQYSHGIKRRSTILLQSLYYASLIKNIITCNGNVKADFVIARNVHLAFVAARRPPAAVKKNDRLAGRLKTGAKCGHGFRKNECNNWDISLFL